MQNTNNILTDLDAAEPLVLITYRSRMLQHTDVNNIWLFFSPINYSLMLSTAEQWDLLHADLHVVWNTELVYCRTLTLTLMRSILLQNTYINNNQISTTVKHWP